MLSFYLAAIETEEDRRLFAYIYTTYKSKMVKMAAAIIENEWDAEDIIEDIFCSIVKVGTDKIREADNKEYLWNYLAAAVRNRCNEYFKQKQKQPPTVEYTDQTDIFFKQDAEDGDLVFNMIVKAIRALPQEYNDVLYYSLIQGFNAAQIAQMFGLKPATVRKRIERGKEMLRKYIGEEVLIQ